MADKRATIILTGEVQDAGFRGKVMRIAQKLDLLGYVENLPNGTVRVICEGSEAAINDFVGKLDIHDDDIDVENTSVEWSDATGEFDWFEVKFDNLGMEMFQGFATAGKKLSDVSKKVDNVAGKVDGVGQKVEDMHGDLKEGFKDTKEGLNRVEGSVDSMHTDMNTRFDTLDDKYGAISRQMNTLTVELQTSTKSLVALTEKIGALIDEKLAE